MQTKGPGLNGLVEGALGQTLDKKLQCSSWGSRPLTVQQVGLLPVPVAWKGINHTFNTLQISCAQSIFRCFKTSGKTQAS